MALKGRYSDAHLCIQLPIETQVITKRKESVPLAALFSLSKTTKLILLDSLLQEVCISSGSDGSLTLSSLGLSVCLSQSQTYFFGAKESPLTIGAYGKQINHSSPVVPVSVSPSPQHPPPSVVVKMAVRCL